MPASRFARLLGGVGAAALAVPLAALLLLAGPASPAHASLGSVPLVVSDYVTDGSLHARLQQLYGPGVKGTGIDFDSTTTTGPISRVWEWTDDRYAHPTSDHPIQLTNYWTVPITVASKAVGVAAVWINPGDDAPELAQFTASPALATALAQVPADAALVHDSATAAWFAVAGPTADPLIAGRSGVSTATPVADLRLTRPGAAPAASGDPNTGVGLAVGVLALLVIVIVIAVVVGRKPQAETVPQAEDLPATTPEPVGSDGVAAKPRAAPKAGEPKAREPKAETPKAETPKTGAPKPRAAPKTESPKTGAPKAPTTAAAAKPRTPVSQKPAASKPRTTAPRAASAKPAVSKPPASKPPVRKPRPPKPPEDGDPGA